MFTDAGIILTKNIILEKTKALLQTAQDAMQQTALRHYREYEIFKKSPKISRGEAYEGLPYLILDYPRIFEREKIFAIRSFFWWGRFFSSTLHIDGDYKKAFAPKIAAAAPLLISQNYFINIGADPWAHHFGADNYMPLKNLLPGELKNVAERQAPVKIAAQWPLTEWPGAATHLYKSWALLLRICLD